MRRILLFLVLAISSISFTLHAQSNCTYTVELNDSFGDGWNGSNLNVVSAGEVYDFTFTTGNFALVCFEVEAGQDITLTYSPGGFENEVTYTLFDAEGNALFSDGPFPATGEVFTTVGECPSCPAPSACDVTIDNLGPFFADINFSEVGDASGYVIEYGPIGFTPGTGTTVNVPNPPAMLTGLDSETDYDVYIQSDCGNGDISPAIGPYSFLTLVSCPVPNGFQVTSTTFDSGTLSWIPNGVTDQYNLEYGPQGFTPGTGTIVTATGFSGTIDGLDENTIYDVYIQADCGPGDQSQWVGPIFFQTDFIDPPAICFYSLELTDEFGFGWNGATVAITINNITETYTLNNIDDDGLFAAFTIEVLDGFPIEIVYTPSFFDNGHSYQFKDPDGIVVFEDLSGQPTPGLVFEGIGYCPICPAPNPDLVSFDFIGTDSVDISWVDQGMSEGFIIEYMPSGVPQGAGLTMNVSGTSTSLLGLNSCVSYDVYLTAICSEVDGIYSTTIGPYTFVTTEDAGAIGDPCTYTLELTDTFGDGWNGSFLEVTNGSTTEVYTLDNINDDGEFAVFEINTFANTPLVFNYTQGGFPNEIIYEFFDPDGNLIFTDGPFPTEGEVFSTFACPTCVGPTSFSMADVNADNATVMWGDPQDSGTLTVEYGTTGFTLGTGTVEVDPAGNSLLMSGLNENTWYDVYLSYDCNADDSAKRLGPISFKTLFYIDVGIVGISNPDPEEACNLSATETVSVLMRNFGQLPQSLITFNYAVNGQLVNVPFPTDGYYTGVIGNDSTEVVDFETTFDFSTPGTYIIQAWTELEGDSNTSNDTITVEVVTATPLPLIEDFEDDALPEGWTTDEFNPLFDPGQHNAPSFVIGDNVWTGDQNFEVITNRVGPINSDSELTFDYRFVDFFAGTVATELSGDNFIVQVSTDCGETYETIFTVDETNHVPAVEMTNIAVDLSAYEGEAINIRWFATWASGDYWLDFDNINILGCPPSLGLLANVSDASQPGEADGSISVTPSFGLPPYTYSWNTGDEEASISGVEAGTYTVIVMDSQGCTSEGQYSIGNITSTEDLAPFVDAVTLSPNPTMGEAFLSLDMNITADVSIEIFNAMGQRIEVIEHAQTNTIRQPLDMTNQPSGIYYVRVSANGQSQIKKLLVTRA